MILVDFDNYLMKKLEDPEFKRLYEKEKDKLEWIFDNVKGAKKQWLIEQITDANENMTLTYLNSLPIKKLLNMVKQYKVDVRHYYW